MKPHTLIVGAGWAGLATAVELTAQGLPVTLLESAKQVGGRARSVNFGAHRVDNGQHLLIGAYAQTLMLMERVGVEPEKSLLRTPLSLAMRDSQGPGIELKAGPLPAPLHLLWGLLAARGLSWHERYRAIRFSSAMARQGFSLHEDQNLQTLLQAHHQPERLIRTLWEPLCLATLNTVPPQASARVFLRVLKDAFAHRRRDSDLLFPAQDLGHLFPEAAVAYLSSKGAHCHTRQRLASITLGETPCSAPLEIGCDDGQRYRADHLVLATPVQRTAQWLAPYPELASLAQGLQQFSLDPITTVYLQYPPSTRLDQPMLGLVNSHAQWIFDRGLICQQDGLMAVVISGPGEHMAWDKASLAETVSTELARLFPHWPAPLEHLVIREKQATFHCRPDIDRLRPTNHSPHPQLWLAGDYTDTGYPATLEGAVRSGVQCAQLIIEQSQNAPQTKH